MNENDLKRLISEFTNLCNERSKYNILKCLQDIKENDNFKLTFYFNTDKKYTIIETRL